jgi:hypothetical protein
MTRTVYQLQVGRIVARGNGAGRIDASELRGLLEQAVTRALESAALPLGRTTRSLVRFDASAGPLSTPGLADAIGQGVARALGGTTGTRGPRRG